MILSLAVGYFTQQAIKSVVCDKPFSSSYASILIARIMPSTGNPIFTPSGSSNMDLDLDTSAAILGAIANPKANSHQRQQMVRLVTVLFHLMLESRIHQLECVKDV
jgi:hypothetical protein